MRLSATSSSSATVRWSTPERRSQKISASRLSRSGDQNSIWSRGADPEASYSLSVTVSFA